MVCMAAELRQTTTWLHLETRDAALCSSPPSKLADLVFFFLLHVCARNSRRTQDMIVSWVTHFLVLIITHSAEDNVYCRCGVLVILCG